MQTYPPELVPDPKLVELHFRLRRELQVFKDQLSSQDMEDMYQAVEWLRTNCAFTPEGGLEYHGGDIQQPLRVPVQFLFHVCTEPWVKLIEIEAQRVGVTLNNSVFLPYNKEGF